MAPTKPAQNPARRRRKKRRSNLPHPSATMSRKCRNTNRLAKICQQKQLDAKGSSTPGGIRTPNLRLRRPLLYPVELQALGPLGEAAFMHFRSIGTAAKAVNLPANRALTM